MNKTIVLLLVLAAVMVIPATACTPGFTLHIEDYEEYIPAMQIVETFETTTEEYEAENPISTHWSQENFTDIRQPLSSTDLAPGVIAVNYIQYINDSLPGRSPFTYIELDTAIWLVEELLAMGHAWENIEVQEFTFWDINRDELALGGRIYWGMVNAPGILGHRRQRLLRINRTSQNVVLTVPGQTDQTIVVMAHYDSPPYASASDNASGVALLLESAQRILEEDNYYTIVYAFLGAEEVGLAGAYWFLNLLTPAQADNIVLAVNADVLIEGPHLVYGTGILPEISEEELEPMRADVLEHFGLNENFNIPLDILLFAAVESGLLEPDQDEVTLAVQALFAAVAEENGFDLLPILAAVASPTDSLAFFLEGFRAVNFVGLEDINNIDPKLAEQLTRLGEGFGDLTVTILHSPLDDFYIIEEIWPGMMNDNLKAFVLLLQALLLNSF